MYRKGRWEQVERRRGWGRVASPSVARGDIESFHSPGYLTWGPRAWKRGSDSAHDYHPICALDWTVRRTNVRSGYKVTSCSFSLCLYQKNKQLTDIILVHHNPGWDKGQLYQRANVNVG